MIGVAVSNRHMGHDHMGYIQLSNNVFEWLETNVGKGSRAGGYIDGCSWLWCWSGDHFQQAMVVFTDAQKALLFKLTWGGM